MASKDLIREEFSEVKVGRLPNRTVTLVFSNQEEADRAHFLIKNSLDLGLPIQIRTKQ